MKLFRIWPAVLEILFKDLSNFSSGGHIMFGRAEPFGKGLYGEHLCEIILNLGQQFR